MGFLVKTLPAVLLLAGNDKDSLACGRFAKAGDVEGCDLAQAGLGGGDQTQVGEVSTLSTAGAARGLAKDHDVLGHGGGKVQEQADAVVVIGDDQLADGAGAEDHGVGRQQEHVQAEAGAGAVDALEMQLAGQGAGFAEALGALDFGAGLAPGDALGLGEQSAPGAGEAAKGAAHVLAGGGPGVPGGDQLALALSVSADERHDITAFSTAGFRENFHKMLCTALTAGRVAWRVGPHEPRRPRPVASLAVLLMRITQTGGKIKRASSPLPSPPFHGGEGVPSRVFRGSVWLRSAGRAGESRAPPESGRRFRLAAEGADRTLSPSLTRMMETLRRVVSGSVTCCVS